MSTARLALPAWSRSLRPVGEVGGFAVLFLVSSLLVAVPFALLTGRKTLGIWYILPFTVVFLVLYQRWRHHEGLRALGVVRPRWGLFLAGGFAGSGLLVATYGSAQLAVGWMEVEGMHPLVGDPATASTGLLLAVAANLGLGFGEELIFRGYVLHRLVEGYRSRVLAVGLSAAFYSAIHIPSGRGYLVLINLFLLGVLLAVAVLLVRSLWLAIGLHAGWNFWLDGVCIYDPATLERTRIVQFQYHLTEPGSLVLFKLTASLVLILAILAFAHRLRIRPATGPLPQGDAT